VEGEGTAAPPRSNGGLGFAEPWEGRAFGLAVALHSTGTFTWTAFSTQLASSIASWEKGHAPGEAYSYYRCWLDALETILDDSQIIGRAATGERIDLHRKRPAGHDHRHD